MLSKTKSASGGKQVCKDCGDGISGGDSHLAVCCRIQELCRYCYRNKFPERKDRKAVPVKPQGKRILNWTERREMERQGFNKDVWSPEFRAEMEDYWKARMRGEV